MMKLLIVLGFLPLFSASPFQGSGARQMMDNLISSLRLVADNPSAAVTIDKIFNNDNFCLKTMDEAIDALKDSADLVASAEGDLQRLNIHVKSMQKMRGETEVVRGVATIMRDLQPLVEKLSPAIKQSKACSSSPDRTFAYLRELSILMHEFSYDSEVAPNKETRDLFHKSGTIISALVTFLSQLQSQSKDFGNYCYPTKEAAVRGMSALAAMIGSLADMFSSVGNVKVGKEIRQGQLFTYKIMNMIPVMKDLDIGFVDCTVQDFDSAAKTLDDLAVLVDEIGIERLENDLGIDISQFYI